VRPVDQSLAEQEPEGELLVVPRGAHRDGQGLAVHADLERLLHRDLIANALPLDLGVQTA